VKSFSLSCAFWLAVVACSPTRPPSSAGDAPASAHDSTSQGSASQAEAAADAEHAGVSAPPNYLLPEGSDARSQSPINIVTSSTVPSKHQIEFHYQTSKEHVENLGHTIKVTYDPGSSLEFDGTLYDLAQFHFHTPSEHLLDGVTYPMELHLVHTEHDHPERFLVIGVLFKEGTVNGLIQTFLRDIPEQAGKRVEAEAKLDASSLFKPHEGYYHYEGSLTTPPFSETVTWLVLDQVHDAAPEQIEAMNRIEGNNARHIQKHSARLVDHAQ
jgi:carbonic anhydrase